MEPSSMMFAAAALAITILNYVFMSGRWIGRQAVSAVDLEVVKRELSTKVNGVELTHLRESLEDRKHAISSLDMTIRNIAQAESDARHKTRGELMATIAKVEEKIDRRIEEVAGRVQYLERNHNHVK